MSTKVVALLAVPLIALAWYAGYRSGTTKDASQDASAMYPVSSKPGAPVATFDGVSISDADLKAQIEEQPPYARNRYTTPEAKKEFLDNMVRFELLAREAQRKGYRADPDVVRQCKRSMVSLFVQREFEEPQQKQAVPEEDLKAYYDAHLSDYQRPERVRVASIFFAAPTGDAAKRKTQKAAAEAALTELKAKDPKDYGFFAEMARSKSEDPASKTAGGELLFLSRDDLSKRTAAEVAEAAFAAQDAGKIIDKVVEAPQGFYLLKLLGREAALDLKLDNVKDSIRSRLLYEKRGDAYKKFLEDLNQKAGLTIHKEAIDAIQIDPAALNPGAGPGQMGGMRRPPMPPGAPGTLRPMPPAGIAPTTLSTPPAGTAPATPLPPGASK